MVKKILYFGPLTNKFLYPILNTLSSFVFAIIEGFLSHFEKELKKENKPTYGKHAFLHYFLMFTAEATTIFIYFIQEKISTRKENTNTHRPNIPAQTEQKNNLNISIIGFIIILSLLDLSNCILDWSTEVESNVYSNVFNAVFILFVVGLCILILNIKYYKHHATAIGIIFIGLIIDSIVNHSYQAEMNIYLYIILMIFCKLFEALQDVIEKYIMETKFVDPLLMLGGEGIVGVVVVGISFFFVSQIECSIKIGLCIKGNMVDDIKQGFSFIFSHHKYLIVLVIRFFFLILYNIFRVLMNYHYSPAHRVIPKTFRKFLVWILSFSQFFGDNSQKSSYVIVGELIGYCFQMFGVMMFVEVLIIGLCGINTDIESEITKREMEEYDTRIDGLISMINSNDNTIVNNNLTNIKNN